VNGRLVALQLEELRSPDMAGIGALLPASLPRSHAVCRSSSNSARSASAR